MSPKANVTPSAIYTFLCKFMVVLKVVTQMIRVEKKRTK